MYKHNFEIIATKYVQYSNNTIKILEEKVICKASNQSYRKLELECFGFIFGFSTGLNQIPLLKDEIEKNGVIYYEYCIDDGKTGAQLCYIFKDKIEVKYPGANV